MWLCRHQRQPLWPPGPSPMNRPPRTRLELIVTPTPRRGSSGLGRQVQLQRDFRLLATRLGKRKMVDTVTHAHNVHSSSGAPARQLASAQRAPACG